VAGPKALIGVVTITAGLVALLDQAAKFAIRGHLAVCFGPPVSACDRVALVGPLGLLRTENPDSAFGLIDGGSLGLLLVLAIALLASQGAIVRARSGGRAMGHLAVSVGLQLGGLIGNLADRVLIGRVTDFIDLRSGTDQGLTLNPADIALVAGGLILAAITWAAASRAPTSGEVQGSSRPQATPS
jgi:signal peptidase II